MNDERQPGSYHFQIVCSLPDGSRIEIATTLSDEEAKKFLGVLTCGLVGVLDRKHWKGEQR